jgi:hypothetical protein
VFASSIGTPIEPWNVNRRWDELRLRAGLGWLRLHDLRHGCATFMLAAGVPARTIMCFRSFTRMLPMRSMSCSGHEDGPIGNMFSSSDDPCRLASGL